MCTLDLDRDVRTAGALGPDVTDGGIVGVLVSTGDGAFA